MAEIPCPRCRVAGTVPDPGLSRWQCRECGHGFFLRRCASCRRVSYVDGFQGYNQSWACTWCAQANPGFRPRRDRSTATAGELAEELGRFAGVAPAIDEGPVAGVADEVYGVGGDDEVDGDGEVDGAEGASEDYGVDGTESADGDYGVDGAGGAGGVGGVSGTGEEREPAGRRVRRGLGVAATLVLIVVAGATIGVAAGHFSSGSGPAAGPSASAAAPDGPIGTAGPGGPNHPAETDPAETRQNSRTIAVTEGGVSAVDFDGVGGTLTVTTAPGPIRLTGTLDWTGQAPASSVTRDQTGHRLRLSYRCAPASPCAENYRLTVPAGVALAVRQPSGQLTLSGLSGRLAITAVSADVVARQLRASHVLAAITAGQFDASFDAPPQSVQVELTRADGTVRVPGTVRYRVTQRVSSGSVDVQVPRDSTAGRTIDATVRDSQLALLPS